MVEDSEFIDNLSERNVNQIMDQEEIYEVARDKVESELEYPDLVKSVETEMQEITGKNNSCTIEIDTLFKMAVSSQNIEFYRSLESTYEAKVHSEMETAAEEGCLPRWKELGARLEERYGDSPEDYGIDNNGNDDIIVA